MEASGYQRVLITACAVRKPFITQRGRLSLGSAATSDWNACCSFTISSDLEVLPLRIKFNFLKK